MSSQLFRQQALAHQGERHWGDCTGLNPVALSIVTWLLLVMVIVSGWLLVSGNYQRKTVVSGVLVADRGTVQVRAPVEGMVEEVTAGLGERVGKGELLLRLRSGIAEVGGEAVAGRLLSENLHQETLLRKLISDRQAEFPVRKSQLDADVAGLKDRQRRLKTLLEAEEAVVALLNKNYQRLQVLHARSLAASGDVEKARIELLKQEGVLMQARLELANTSQTLATTGRDVELLKLEHERALGELKRSLSELHKQNVQLQADQAVEVVAPVTGTVTNLLMQQGQSVLGQQPMLSLVPEGSVLEAELHVPSRAIGFLSEGLHVNLRFDTFPYQKYGLQQAQVREISRTAVIPGDGGGEGASAEPFFKVIATLERQSLEAYGSAFALRPGMQFQADIVLENRSLLEWLLEPLLIKGRIFMRSD